MVTRGPGSWRLPGEDVFAGIRVGRCAKLCDDHSVFSHGADVRVRPDEPEHKEHTQTHTHTHHEPGNHMKAKWNIFSNPVYFILTIVL